MIAHISGWYLDGTCVGNWIRAYGVICSVFSVGKKETHRREHLSLHCNRSWATGTINSHHIVRTSYTSLHRVKRRRSWPIAFWPAKLLIQAIGMESKRKEENKRTFFVSQKEGTNRESAAVANRCSKSLIPGFRPAAAAATLGCFCASNKSVTKLSSNGPLGRCAYMHTLSRHQGIIAIL